MIDKLHEAMQRIESEIGYALESLAFTEERCKMLEQRRNLWVARRDMTTLSEKFLGIRFWDAAEVDAKASKADEELAIVTYDLEAARERLRDLEDLNRLLRAEYDQRQHHINLLGRGSA